MPSSSDNATPTRSARKLSQGREAYLNLENEPRENNDDEMNIGCDITDIDQTGSRIFDMDILNMNLSSSVVCRYCKQPVRLLEVKRKGLGSQFAFHCESGKCNNQRAFPNCAVYKVNNLENYSINRRVVFAMRCIGDDRADLQTFCGVMDLPPPVHDNTYNIINKTVQAAATTVQVDSMRRAAEEEFAQAEPIPGEIVRNTDASSDGTWMTPGHSSKMGAATVIGCKTGRVLDTGTRSKVCKSCDVWLKRDRTTASFRRWQQTHQCSLDHEGSSGSMEAEIIKDCFHSSLQKYNLRYTGFVGDGDTNTFKKVQESKPYGDVPIHKEECVGHVQKRMGCRLRNLKKQMKGQKLCDGKRIEGKGRLTDKQTDSIQRMYGNAIRRNKNGLATMKQHVWAIYFHKLSTDARPQHHMCSEACPYRTAQREGKAFKHKNSLPEAVMNTIKPIFRDLAHPGLLKKCVRGFTQNANESINNLIWKFAPKKKNHGIVTVKTAVALAVGVFNDGAVTLALTMKQLDLEVGVHARRCFDEMDADRIQNAQKQANAASHEARIRRRQQRLHQDEAQEQADGFPYLAGGH